MSDRHGNLQKYQNPNPIQRYLIHHFLGAIGELISGLEVATVLDAGCAESFVSRYLVDDQGLQIRVTGVDLDLMALQRGRNFFPLLKRVRGDVICLPFADGRFDLVLCTEVLEHLPDPALGLRELLRVSQRYCLLSVPHEPWFRTLNFLRGKHLHSWGNDPEHLHNWTAKGFCQFVSQEAHVLRAATAFPWSLILASK